MVVSSPVLIFCGKTTVINISSNNEPIDLTENGEETSKKKSEKESEFSDFMEDIIEHQSNLSLTLYSLPFRYSSIDIVNSSAFTELATPPPKAYFF
ncbi:MAG: hypothetical protein ACKVQB_05125 [Bacteroidia bacterium]